MAQTCDIEVLETHPNQLLKRTELLLSINHERSTIPPKETVAKSIASLYQSTADRIIVYGMKNETGTHTSTCNVRVYASKEDLMAVEKDFMIARKTGVRETKKPRKTRKVERKTKYARFGTLRKAMRKAEKKDSRD